MLVGVASRDCERERVEAERTFVERAPDVRDAEGRAVDDEREDEDGRELLEREEEFERWELVREEDEPRDEERVDEEDRSLVACERLPRRVDSLELTVHPPPSSSNGQTRPTEIH